MKKQELTKSIVHYVFDPQPEMHFATSVTAVFSGNKAMLIDAACEDQLKEVLDEFAAKDIEVEKVIISHFHDDHMEGLKLLPKATVYGSSHFQHTLDLWTDKEEHRYFTPAIIIDEPFTFTYGEHEVTLTPQPGHSACTMLTIIDNRFIHIGDEIMFSTDGVPLLPTSDWNDRERLLGSLEKLKGYSDFTLIPSHGPAFSGETLADEIANRYNYMKAVHDAAGDISYEDAIRNCTCDFAHSEWHENNCYNGE